MILEIIGKQEQVESLVGTEYLSGDPAQNYEILFGGLQQTVVPFIYRKKDGSLRFAVGTTNPGLVPVSSEQIAKLSRIASLVEDSAPTQGAVEMLEAIKQILGESSSPKKSTVSPDYQVYYDFEKGWRQFHKNNVVLILAFRDMES